MRRKRVFTFFAAAWVVLLSVAIWSPLVRAGYIYGGGFSETVYGVADYFGPPVPGIPQYIPNAVTGLNSVLVSPGGGFLTADTSNPNNIADTGLVGLPYATTLVGGSNANGVFGAGATLLTPTLVGFTLVDINPDGGGAAAYSVASMISTFTEDGNGFPAAVGGMISVGTWLAVTGVYGSPLSAGAVALTTFVESLNPGSPFFGGRSYELVLAAAAIGNYNNVAYSDINDVVQPTAVMINNGVSPFFGLAVASELLPVAGMIGDTITVTTTLTVIADPQFYLGSIEPTPDLLSLAGPLPDLSLMGTTAVPEPSVIWLLGIAMLGLVGRSRWQRLAKR